MANYSLVLDTKFKPFSYAEMLAPVAAATQAHQALEEEYGNLSAKADVWENMANEQSDPLAYKMYKGYSDDLRDRADTLLREGLNASSRKGMLDMRARYSKEIAPIETAYKRREELAAEQRKAYAANPTLRYERYANAMSLDDFIKNPSIDYGRSYSGALLTQQVAQAAANYAKVLTREGKLEKLGLPFQYTKDLGRGATPEQVLAVINKAAQDGEEGAISFLRGIRDQVIASSGTNAWITPGSAAAQERDAFANMGLYSAIGQTEIKDYTDKYNMDNALEVAKERRAAEAQAAANAAAKAKMYDINPTKFYGTSEVTKKNAKIAETMMKDIYPYFWNGGKKALTQKGLEVLRRKPQKKERYDSEKGVISTYMKEDPEKEKLIAALKETGVTDKMINQAINGDSTPLNQHVREVRRRINSGELATGTPNIDVYRLGLKNDSDKNYITSKLSNAAGHGELQMVTGLNAKTYKGLKRIRPKVYAPGEKTTASLYVEKVSREDFLKKINEEKVKPLYLINSPTTYTQMVELEDGTMFILPKGVLGDDVYDDLNSGTSDGKIVEGVSGIYQRIEQALTPAEKATYLNMANSKLASVLTSATGTEISPNDGTVEFNL